MNPDPTPSTKDRTPPTSTPIAGVARSTAVMMRSMTFCPWAPAPPNIDPKSALVSPSTACMARAPRGVETSRAPVTASTVSRNALNPGVFARPSLRVPMLRTRLSQALERFESDPTSVCDCARAKPPRAPPPLSDWDTAVCAAAMTVSAVTRRALMAACTWRLMAAVSPRKFIRCAMAAKSDSRLTRPVSVSWLISSIAAVPLDRI